MITSTKAQRGKEQFRPVSETIGHVFDIKTFSKMSFLITIKNRYETT